MRTSVVFLATVNALVLTVAVGVVVGEYLTGQVAASRAGTAAEHDSRPLQHPHAADGDGATVLVAADDRGDEEAGTPEGGGAEGGAEQPSDGQGDAEHSAGDQRGQAAEAAPLEMGRAAEVVAACESGKRWAHGTPVLGTHRWHITNHHGGTDSGAFQFVDATWQRVAAEIGASQYERAKDAPPEVQLTAFEWLWRRDPGAWNASRSCWAPVLRG